MITLRKHLKLRSANLKKSEKTKVWRISRMANDARSPAARDRGVDHVSTEEGAFVFPWEKSRGTMFGKAISSYTTFFSQMQTNNLT